MKQETTVKKRICCFCERWESGGIESFLFNMYSRLDLEKIEIDIAAAELRESVFTDSLREKGVHFFELSGSQRNFPANHRLFRALLKRRHYDVLHLNVFHGFSLAYLKIARECGVPVRIAHSHNTALRRSGTKPLKLLLHYTARRRYAPCATELWACSKAAADFLFPKRLLVQNGFRFIPNGIDVERFRFNPEGRAAARKELGIGGETFLVGNVGRLCYQKNQMFLLDIFAELVKKRPESRLLLVGEGEDKKRLQARCASLGIAEKVIFYGTTDHVERLLWAMDIFVFPSRFEGLSVAIVEAQAAGLPVLCSNVLCQEAFVIPWILSAPLKSGANAWSKAIFMFPSSVQRQECASLVKKAGFDLGEVSGSMERAYKTSPLH